jgi:hypothetical protein
MPSSAAFTLQRGIQSSGRRSYDEQYRWLCERVDPASGLERAFLDYLYQHHHGMPGLCVFLDGPHHHSQRQAAHDREAREELRDRGYRVIAIRHDRRVDEQVSAYPEVFAGT